MKTTPKAIAIASLLAAAGLATGAAAQTSYGQAYSTYQQQQSAYQQQQLAYTQAKARYDADRSAYDARYGYGAYERRYGVFNYTTPTVYGSGYGTVYPAYPTTSYPYSAAPYTPAPSTYGYGYGTTTPYGYGTTTPYGYTAPYGTNPYYAGAYGANSAYTGAVACNTSTSSSGNLGILAALAQAALGGGFSTNNIVNQAVLGAGVNSSIGARTASGVRCDSRGPYYTYSQTQPYREGYYDSYGRWHTSPTNRTYARCRIAPAPADVYGQQYRYVRVCPDSSGRYRITA